jgi:hypothetical protein
MDLLKAALSYVEAGLCALPAYRAQKRPAVRGRWEPYKTRLPTETEIGAWFANAHDGLCLVCGADGHRVESALECPSQDGVGDGQAVVRLEVRRPGLAGQVCAGPHLARGDESNVGVVGDLHRPPACPLARAALGQGLDAPRAAPVQPPAVARPRLVAEQVAVLGSEFPCRHPFQGDQFLSDVRLTHRVALSFSA